MSSLSAVISSLQVHVYQIAEALWLVTQNCFLHISNVPCAVAKLFYVLLLINHTVSNKMFAFSCLH